jgi:2-polyprenyl-6-methoxyphenol hydroxylase-like FAD-dependent oxidoreductase
MQEFDVIVVGGGPVGLTLAGELRLAGLQVAVVERRRERVQQSRALTLHGRTLEMLGLRGLAGRFLARGMKIPQGHFAVLPTRLDFSVFETDHPYTLFIPQAVTEQLLEERALELGVEILRGVEVRELRTSTEDVTLQAVREDQPLQMRARYVVGADGARSIVRQQAGIDFAGVPATRTLCLADVVLAHPPAQQVYAGCNAAGLMMVAPLGDGRHHRIVLMDAEHGGIPLAEPVTLEEIATSAQRIAGIDFGPRDAIWLSRFADETRLAAQYRQGRILLAGDAAHIHMPAGGQGMNVGMQDAMNLGWKLAAVLRGEAPDALLDSYHHERHPVGEALYNNTLAQTALMSQFDPRGLALRDAVSQLIRSPEANRMLASQLSGFGVTYDVALTTLPAGLPRGLSLAAGWTGRRLPDQPLRLDNNGNSNDIPTLHQQLHSGQWLWWDLSPSGAAVVQPDGLPARTRVLRAHPVQAMAELVGIHALLVRPDGYADFALTDTTA